jgi:putative hydrolase of the HAD superfamily
MIKTVIFDNGGVLVDDEWLIFLKTMAKAWNVDVAEARKILYPYEIGPVLGEVSFEDFLKHLEEKVGENYDISVFRKEFPLRKEVVSWLEDLKKDFSLVLLSNDLGDFEDRNKHWKLERFFGENIFHSTKIKLAKPDEKAFQFVLDKLNVKPEETVFIDDKKRNTEVAKKLGIKAIQFITLEQVKKEFKETIKNDKNIVV